MTESASIPMSWLGEFKSLGDFTLHVIKVCSPGPATDADLIIAYMGLYCLFAECATMTSAEAREDLENQAQTCQDGLEAVLSNLGFHTPTTIDNVLAMYFAVSPSPADRTLLPGTDGFVPLKDTLLLPKRHGSCRLDFRLQGVLTRAGPQVTRRFSIDRHPRRAAPEGSSLLVHLLPRKRHCTLPDASFHNSRPLHHHFLA